MAGVGHEAALVVGQRRHDDAAAPDARRAREVPLALLALEGPLLTGGALTRAPRLRDRVVDGVLGGVEAERADRRQDRGHRDDGVDPHAQQRPRGHRPGGLGLVMQLYTFLNAWDTLRHAKITSIECHSSVDMKVDSGPGGWPCEIE